MNEYEQEEYLLNNGWVKISLNTFTHLNVDYNCQQKLAVEVQRSWDNK